VEGKVQTITELLFALLVAVGALFVPQQAAVVLLALILLQLRRMSRI
jgi:hypothetical protein